ncbi:MAG: Fic family protein [Sodaliphilus sp.]
MATYVWQHPDWLQFRYDESQLVPLLEEVHRLRGELLGCMKMLGLEAQNDAQVEMLTSEIVNSSQIEGEMLNRDSVRSSVARQLGINGYDGPSFGGRNVEGVVQVMLDATVRYATPLSAERLFRWHASLFPTGFSGGGYRIRVGAWREGEAPMQVVSGAFGHETVHYEAPPSNEVPTMMDQFIAWLNAAQSIDPIVKAAIAHFWFVSIHPFDDGNGRLCRAITEWLLSKADATPRRYYSLSAEILRHRNLYYRHLESAQKGDSNLTEWILWFVRTIRDALVNALQKIECIIHKVHFWDAFRHVEINERQRKIINRMLDGFEGRMQASRWSRICHCSRFTAIRDINDLISKGIMHKSEQSGRSTHYLLASPPASH